MAGDRIASSVHPTATVAHGQVLGADRPQPDAGPGAADGVDGGGERGPLLRGDGPLVGRQQPVVMVEGVRVSGIVAASVPSVATPRVEVGAHGQERASPR